MVARAAAEAAAEAAAPTDGSSLEEMGAGGCSLPPIGCGAYDLVLMNPPFGTQQASNGIDMRFLRAGLALCAPDGAVYSLNKTSTRRFIAKTAASWGASARVVAELQFEIPRMYKHHKHASLDVEVDFWRFTPQADREGASEGGAAAQAPFSASQAGGKGGGKGGGRGAGGRGRGGGKGGAGRKGSKDDDDGDDDEEEMIEVNLFGTKILMPKAGPSAAELAASRANIANIQRELGRGGGPTAGAAAGQQGAKGAPGGGSARPGGGAASHPAGAEGEEEEEEEGEDDELDDEEDEEIEIDDEDL